MKQSLKWRNVVSLTSIAMYYFLYWYTEITDTQHYTVMKLHYKYLFIFHIYFTI